MECHPDGSFVIKDPRGELRGRYRDGKVMATHYVFALRENDKLGDVVGAAYLLTEDESIRPLLADSVGGRRLLISLEDLRAGWKRMEIPATDEGSKDA